MISGPAPADGARQQDWRLLLGLFSLGTLIEITAWGHAQAFAPLFLARELGVPASDVPFWTGVMAALPLTIAVPLAPFWGVLADRYSRKLMIVRSLVAECVAYSIAAASHSLLAFMVVRLIMGLAFGNNALVVATLSLATPERRLATAISYFAVTFPIGLSAGPLIGSAVIAAVGLRGLYVVDAGLCVFAALMVTLCVREPRRVSQAQFPGVRRQLRTLFSLVATRPMIRWNFALWFLFSGGVAALDPYIPVMISERYSGPDLAFTIGVVLALFGVATGVFTPLTARVADRFGQVRTLALAALLLALVALLLPLPATVAILAGLLLVRAAPQAATMTVLFTHLVRHTPAENRAGVMALSPLPRNFAMLVVPLVASGLSGFGTAAVCALASVLFIGSLLATLMMLRAERPVGLTAAGLGEA